MIELIIMGLSIFTFLIFVPLAAFIVGMRSWKKHRQTAAVLLIVGALLYAQRVYIVGEHLFGENASIVTFVAGVAAMTFGYIAGRLRKQ